MSGGICYLAGAGPGDPGLLTVKAREVIASAELLVYDNLIHAGILLGAPAACRLVYAGKRAGKHVMKQADINQLLVDSVRQGLQVVRLKGGDPFTFGRGGEEAEALAEAGMRFEVIPGITSGIAVPAYAGIPLTHRGHSGVLTFVTGHECPRESGRVDWKALAKIDGTLAIYMGAKNLPGIVTELVDGGKSIQTPAAFVQWGSTHRQRSVLGTLADICEKVAAAGLSSPAIVVIGPVAALAEKLDWYKTGPLHGLRVAVTRPTEQNSRLAALLEEQGAEVLQFPVIAVEPIPQLQMPADLPRQADWLLFTSVNGVDYFWRNWTERRDLRDLAGLKLAAVGPATRAALESRGLKVDFTARVHTAEALAAELSAAVTAARAWHVCGTLAGTELAAGLAAKGWPVERLEVYRNTAPARLVERYRDVFELQSPDWILFCSSSAVRNFRELAGASFPSGVRVGSLGPVTSQTVRACGWSVDLEAVEANLETLVRQLVETSSGRQ